MAKIVTFNERHVVTPTEAAYGTLFGAMIPRVGWRWFQASDWPQVPTDPTPWELQSLAVGIESAAGEEYNGRLINLFGVLPKGQGVTELPSTEIYVYGCRSKLLRPQLVLWGFGAYFRTPSLIATDVVTINAIARLE